MATTDVLGEMPGSVTRVAVEDLASHLATLEAELSGGRLIELVRGETVVAEVRGKMRYEEPQVQPYFPDFMGRMKEIYGSKVFPEGYMTKAIRDDRDAQG